MMKIENSFSASMNAKIFGSRGKTIILAHGYGGDQSLWDKITENLSRRCRVLVFDWSFAGTYSSCSSSDNSKNTSTTTTSFDASKYSSFEAFSNDLISLVDEMNLKSFVFVGHSMSGMIGCIASIKRPDLFEHLVLLGASPRYINSEDYEGGFDMSSIEDIFFNIQSNFQSWAMSFAALAVGSTDPASVDKYGKSMLRMKPDVALEVAKTIFLTDNRDVLEKVTVPCTIIQTANDVAVPMSACTYMRNKIGGNPSLVIIDADGHLPQLTAHQLLLDALHRILGFDCSIKYN